MLYGNGWWGVLEINYGVAAMHFVAAAMGPWFWKLRPLSAAGDFAIGGADGELHPFLGGFPLPQAGGPSAVVHE